MRPNQDNGTFYHMNVNEVTSWMAYLRLMDRLNVGEGTVRWVL